MVSFSNIAIFLEVNLFFLDCFAMEKLLGEINDYDVCVDGAHDSDN